MKNLLNSRKLPLILAAIIMAAVLAVYLKSVNYDYINLDDPPYVKANELVNGGLSAKGIMEAFTKTQQSLWAPMTWLSFMADAEFSGMEAGGFHRTNMILHGLNAVLFFVFLYRATGFPWKSFFAASLWALHPMRVESVAWITERKDLVSGLFFLLCLLAYLEYARREKKIWYFAALIAMFLGYASKPIMVVMPVMLLAADVWPLERIGEGGEKTRRVLIEKVPFFLLSGALTIITFVLQKTTVGYYGEITLGMRAVSVVTSYAHYLVKTFWPSGLVMQNFFTAVRYTGWLFAVAAAALVLVSLAAWKTRKSAPFLLAGWSWYVFALFPVCGIIPFGIFFLADHFLYLPHMGIAVVSVWGMGVLAEKQEIAKKVLSVFAVLAVVGLSVLSSLQLNRWKDGHTLFTQNNALTGGDSFSSKLLGNYYLENDQIDDALPFLEYAISNEPGDYDTHMLMGNYLQAKERHADAVASFMRVVALNPQSPEAHYNIAHSAEALKNTKVAAEHLRKALEIDPGYAAAMIALGRLLRNEGRYGEAMELFERANSVAEGSADFEITELENLKGNPGGAESLYKNILASNPDDLPSNFNYGLSLSKQGRTAEARERFNEVLRIKPDHPQAHFQLGLILAGEMKKEEAFAHFQEAVKKAPEDPAVNFNLALAAAELGKDELAVRYFKKHLSLAPDDPVSHFNLAFLLLKAGDRIGARFHLKEVLRLDPSDKDAREWLKKLSR